MNLYVLVVNMRFKIKTDLQHSRFESEVEDHLSVNTQLLTTDDGVGLLWNIQIQNVSVEDQF